MSKRLTDAEKEQNKKLKEVEKAEKKRLKEEKRAEKKRLKEELEIKKQELAEASKKQNSFSTFTFPVLQTNILLFSVLNDGWNEDKRYPETAVQKFLLRNADTLKYLDINASGEYAESGSYVLKLTTSKYIGCIPLLSPKTGLLSGNLIVTGRFGEDVSELLSVIGDFVAPEFNEKLKLSSGSFIKPPLYFECQNYIDHYIEAKRYKWRKFDNIEKCESTPKNSTRWGEYALKSYDPSNTFKFPNSCNILSKNHKEWEELNYVLNLCIGEVMSSRTPLRSRMAYMSKIASLQNTYDRNSLPFVNEVKIHMSDPGVIKSLKEVANRVLQNASSSQNAWRLDYAEFFERYVQYLMKDVARSKGARITCNPHFSIYGQKPAWALKYIEPDIVIDKSDVQYIIDAKYKSHIYQVNSDSEQLRETFREDFHQVLAYSSFSGNIRKNVMLIYPSDFFICRELDIVSGINGCSSKAYLVGIPLKKSDLEETRKGLSNIIRV